MAAEGDQRHGSTLRDYLNVVRRRKWIMLQAIVIIPAIAVLLAMRQQKLYTAEAQVLVNYQDLSSQVTGTAPGSSVFQSVDRAAATLANVAHTPPVAAGVVQALHLRGWNPDAVLAETSVQADPLSNLLYFDATDTDPQRAAKIAAELARQFTYYQRKLDTSALQLAAANVSKRLEQLRAARHATSPLYTNLAGRLELLNELSALQTSHASVVRTPSSGYQIAPRPFRNGLLGLLLGLVLGIGLAFLREALDTRVRSSDEVTERLGLPLLARLTEPPRRLRRDNELVMFAEPHSPQAEAFRMLRTNLDFVRVDRKAETIMITSSVEGEGKSTTAANLATALARGGQHVVLVDLDLRRPFLNRFFDLEGRAGLTQVALGYAKLEDALTPIPVLDTPSAFHTTQGGNGNGMAHVDGLLEVLGSGPTPPNVDEFVGTRAVAHILAKLRERADIVLIDATPLLVVGDAMALAANVDAMIVVTRLNVVRRPMLRDLHQALDRAPAEKLGFIVTGADEEEAFYGYEAYHYRSRTQRAAAKELTR